MEENTSRAFDLNVGNALEHWTVEFALREIIANDVQDLDSVASKLNVVVAELATAT
jgi:hypothetical protein